MKTLPSLIAALALCALAGGCAKKIKPDSGVALSGHVTGTVTYRERIALPQDAKIIVSLEDVSRVDKGAAFVAQQTLRPTAQVPIPFDLRYIPSSIDRRHRYAVRAAIVDSRDELLWTSTDSYPVLFNEPEQAIAITVQRVTNAVAAAAPPLNSDVPFKCDDIEFIARFGANKVEIQLAARTVTLPQVLSGSGTRYSDGSTTFWNKGNEALFEIKGVSYTGCKTDPVPLKFR